MTQYYQSILKYIKSRINNLETARDLTQEVFLKIEKARASNMSKSYVYTVAKNIIVDYYRKRAVPTDELSDNENVLSSYLPDDLDCRLEDCLQDYLYQIDEESARLLVESDLKGTSQKELAQSSGIEYATLRSKIQRGRKKIRSMFDEDCHLELSTTGKVIGCEYKNKKKSSC